MGTNEANINALVFVPKQGHEPVFIMANVENDAVIFNSIRHWVISDNFVWFLVRRFF